MKDLLNIQNENQTYKAKIEALQKEYAKSTLTNKENKAYIDELTAQIQKINFEFENNVHKCIQQLGYKSPNEVSHITKLNENTDFKYQKLLYTNEENFMLIQKLYKQECQQSTRPFT